MPLEDRRATLGDHALSRVRSSAATASLNWTGRRRTGRFVIDATTEFDQRDPSGLEAFVRVRPRVFGVAHRMLGSVGDAEDMVQDVWVRWQSCDRTAVRDDTAFLVTMTSRMCLNAMQSARARREVHVEPWLSEQIDVQTDPALAVERDDALQCALLLLEKLTPNERAAYILREAFDYPYELIGHAIQVTDVNARQIVRRARRHLGTEHREPATSADQRRLVVAFTFAARTGDMSALEEIFAVGA